ncbi:MAG TPA: hypothetical protein PKV62_06480 [Oscillospiraceae bacterium]|nr:hypothetical protein [Oscillospiraceae bacterium]
MTIPEKGAFAAVPYWNALTGTGIRCRLSVWREAAGGTDPPLPPVRQAAPVPIELHFIFMCSDRKMPVIEEKIAAEIHTKKAARCDTERLFYDGIGIHL